MQNEAQLKLLKTIIGKEDPKNLQEAIKDIPDAIFTDDKLAYVFKSSTEHFAKYGNCLSRSNFFDSLENSNLPEETKSAYQLAFDNILNARASDGEYEFLRDQVMGEYKRDLTRKTLIDAIGLLDQPGRESEALECIDGLNKNIFIAPCKKVSFVSAAQLQTMDLPPVKFLVDELIPEGLTVIAAPQKAGKSAFAMQMGSCIAQGRPFLGRATKQGTVIYYSLEQSNAMNKQRLELQGLGWSDNFLIIGDKDKQSIRKLNKEGVDQMRKTILDNKAEAVIIDTWQRMAPVTNNRRDAYQNAVADFSPVQDLAAETRCAIIALFHRPKSSHGDEFNGVMGSVGFVSTADMTILLNRNRLEPDGVLQSISRVAKEFKWCITFNIDNLTWAFKSLYSDIRKGQIGKDILNVFRQEERELSIKDVFDFLQVDKGYSSDRYPVVAVSISRLARCGTLTKTGRGKYVESELSKREKLNNTSVNLDFEQV